MESLQRYFGQSSLCHWVLIIGLSLATHAYAVPSFLGGSGNCGQCHNAGSGALTFLQINGTTAAGPPWNANVAPGGSVTFVVRATGLTDGSYPSVSGSIQPPNTSAWTAATGPTWTDNGFSAATPWTSGGSTIFYTNYAASENLIGQFGCTNDNGSTGSPVDKNHLAANEVMSATLAVAASVAAGTYNVTVAGVGSAGGRQIMATQVLVVHVGATTPTVMPSRTATRTATVSSTRSATPSATRSATPSPTSSATATYTATRTASPSFTPSPPASATATPTVTRTATPTVTVTATFSATPTATPSATLAPAGSTDTVSPTVSPTFSVSPSATPTASPSSSATPTASATPSATVTPTVSPSDTVTRTATRTLSPSATPSATPSFSASPSVSLTRSATPSATPTITGSPSVTVVQSATPTPATAGRAFPDALRPVVVPNPAGPDGARASFILLANAQDVRLRVYTVAFVVAREQDLGALAAGWNSVAMDLHGLAGGTYFLEVRVVQGPDSRRSQSRAFFLRP